ncbi:MAG: membrane dipeptidase [Bacteroidota bacterium]
MRYPVVDLHCDLLSYLEARPGADPEQKGEIGCNFSDLEAGGIKLQVMAIYTATEKGSAQIGLNQSRIFQNLISKYDQRLSLLTEPGALKSVSSGAKWQVIAAIENASGFCEEHEPLMDGFKRLEEIISQTGQILYIGLTHHGENRFGGGNTTKTGLKPDGKILLDYLHGKKIALDLSHTSDALAYEIFNHLSKHDLDIPVIASHSNYRKVFDHPRNLPDDIAKEIIKRKGLIGVNFLRAFLNNDDPNAIYDHIQYGISLGGEKAICFGADYFYTGKHPDQTRVPFYFKEVENASCYPFILERLHKVLSEKQLQGLSHGNAFDFISRIRAT